MILEKPLATSVQSWGNITKLIESADCQILYSQPWTFSKLWQRVINELGELSFPISIEIRKKGLEFRSDFSGLQDWLPHDLYLIESLIRRKEISGEPIVVSRPQESNQIQINVGDKVYIKVSFIIDDQREMFWEVSANHGTSFSIDFVNSYFNRFDGGKLLSQETFLGDHPLMNMFTQYVIDVDEFSGNYIPSMQEIVATNFQDSEIWFS